LRFGFKRPIKFKAAGKVTIITAGHAIIAVLNRQYTIACLHKRWQ
jgi:hypothetical protein